MKDEKRQNQNRFLDVFLYACENVSWYVFLGSVLSLVDGKYVMCAISSPVFVV